MEASGVEEPVVDLSASRSTGEVLRDALRCYRGYPLLFLALTLIVIVPYAAIVWAVNDQSILAVGHHVGAAGVLIVLLLPPLVVQPLISALHVNAVVEIGQGRAPSLPVVFQRGVRALPVVAAAQVVAAVGIAIGFVALIVPGIVLAACWAVVPQAAAIEHTDWMGALRRSFELTRDNRLHVLGVLFSVGIITAVIARGVAAGIGSGAGAAQLAVAIAVQAILYSFAALTTALLYYDLLARGVRPSGL